jgi:ribosomal protein S18 acetylase RimI-like enzyme
MNSPAPKPIAIRTATMKDAATIAVFNIRMAMETENLRLDPNTIERGVKRVFEDKSRGEYYVAEVDGAVVGCLMVTHEWSDWRDGDMWWIQSVYVAPEARKLGVFKALFAHVETLARESEAVAIRLYVDRHNDRAKSSYQKMGLELTEYDVMHKSLDGGSSRG